MEGREGEKEVEEGVALSNLSADGEECEEREGGREVMEMELEERGTSTDLSAQKQYDEPEAGTTSRRRTRGKRGGDAPLLPCKPPPKHHTTIKWDGGARDMRYRRMHGGVASEKSDNQQGLARGRRWGPLGGRGGGGEDCRESDEDDGAKGHG
jgi:hypothetical protein